MITVLIAVAFKTNNERALTFHDCFRLIFKIWGPHSISHEFVKRGLSTFDAIRRNGCYSLIRRVFFPKNEIILDIFNNSSFRATSLYQEWTKILYV